MSDARDMAEALTGLGFTVILGLDLDKRGFDLKTREFVRALVGADVGVFFYAGHGLQVGGVNYLVATDAKLEAERDLDFETIKLDFVLQQMEREAKTNIVFLDACRNNPLTRNLARTMGTRGVSENGGLAPVASGLGTFIAYATQPGNVASDGSGRNSPFTTALKKHVTETGLAISDLMIEVRRDVVAATRGAQVPWDHSALQGRFFFRPGDTPAAPSPPPAAITSNSPANNDTEVGKYRKGADAGDATAMFNLGLIYQDGRGVAKDEAEAVRWYRKGADAGDPAAAINLGIMYQKGWGVAKNEAEAVRWFRKAADVGATRGMVNLGLMYEYGRGVAKNEAEAVRWYRKGADAGDESAMRNLGSMYAGGQGVAKDKAEAVRWYRKAADAGDTFAMNNLGFMYANGQGVAKNDAEAVRWYQKGADAGIPTAMSNLGFQYALGRGVPRNPVVASQWVFKALQAGDSHAYNVLTNNPAWLDPNFRREMQRRLKEAGIYNGAIDGTFGPPTIRAFDALKQRAP